MSMTLRSGVVCGLASLAVLVKLFTYEYVLKDDPTTGIALRTVPSFANGPETLSQAGVALVSDENAFSGAALYRGLVTWGWLAAIASAVVFLRLDLRRGREPGGARGEGVRGEETAPDQPGERDRHPT